MSVDTQPELTEESLKAFTADMRALAAMSKGGQYTLEPGPAYRQMQLRHNRKVLRDSVRHTLARLYVEDGVT